ncbi:MAG: crossover junction endodeoxyribonuclease RuvC [Gemmatimonadota bacterium]
MRVLGVDPGSAITGYGVVEMRAGDIECVDCGTIPGGDGTLADRLVSVFDGLTEVIEAFHPAEVAIENAFLGKNVRTLAVMSQTRGVLVLAARKAGLPVHEYTPREVKQSVVGTGRASKTQIAWMVSTLLHMPAGRVPRDATDSLALALCHLNRGARNGGRP